MFIPHHTDLPSDIVFTVGAKSEDVANAFASMARIFSWLDIMLLSDTSCSWEGTRSDLRETLQTATASAGVSCIEGGSEGLCSR